MKVIVLVAGGTGGHFFSAVAVGEELISRGYVIHLITDFRCQSYIKNINIGIIFHTLDLPKFPKEFLPRVIFLLKLLMVINKSVKLLHKIKPNILIGFGGYPVISSMFAAVYLKIPIIIHEQNSFIGKANKFFAKFASKIALSYEKTQNLSNLSGSKILITGGIVRENIRDIIRKKESSKSLFTIFVFGGSQGAKIFTELIPQAIKILVQKKSDIKLFIIQQASHEDQAKIEKIYSRLDIKYELQGFFYDIDKKYQISDLVIARAGASTIEELTYTGLPALFIPLPSATNNHQYYNAKLLSDYNAGWYIEQKDISAIKLASKILQLISDRSLLEQASQNLLQRKREGHKLLSNLIEDVML